MQFVHGNNNKDIASFNSQNLKPFNKKFAFNTNPTSIYKFYYFQIKEIMNFSSARFISAVNH